MTTSLVGTTGTTTLNDDGRYIQLNDIKYGARYPSGEVVGKNAETKDPGIMVDTEVSVKSHEAL